MISPETQDAYDDLMTMLTNSKVALAPRALNALLIGAGHGAKDIQRSVQLGLSKGSIQLDRAMHFTPGDGREIV